jgi:GTP-binding protein Era
MDIPSSIEFKSGFVAVMGRPNVGKSTLINGLLGQKIAAVSPRPQTTRRRQLGIITSSTAQVIFVDTPGVHQPHHKLGEAMNQQAREALEDADLVLWIVDTSQPPTSEDQLLADLVRSSHQEAVTILVQNKIDLVPPHEMAQRQSDFQALLPISKQMFVSATRGDGCQELLGLILERLPNGPLYYPEEQVTDLYEREIAADLIREAALIHLREEVPHGLAVRIDEYKDRNASAANAGAAYIAATLLLERETHKPILIGKGGTMLKKIGSTARQEIEKLVGRKVFLDLRVKVRKNWRDDEETLKSLGFK